MRMESSNINLFSFGSVLFMTVTLHLNLNEISDFNSHLYSYIWSRQLLAAV